MTEQVEVKEPVKLNLYQKIHAVMNDVEYLQKDDNIQFNNTKYKAISEEKVTSAVRASLLKHGLVILPVEQEHHREGTLSTVNTKYKIVDIDTGQYEILVSSGTGADTQDKGVGKAMTYSYKYLLLRTFAIPTGEDPDKISSAELDEKMKKESEQPQVKPISPKQIGLIKTQTKKIAIARKVKDEDVYEKLGVQVIEQLTSQQASKAIETLNKWVEQLGEKQGA
jgi:hypothetical protein